MKNSIVREVAKMSPHIVLHQNSVVHPITSFDIPSRTFNGGVVTELGKVCKVGLHTKAGYKNELTSPFSSQKSHVQGHFLYAGMLQNRHFGHFLIESLSRLWAIKHLKRVDGIVFILRSIEAPIASFVQALFELLLEDIPIYIAYEPTRFEILAVPQQITSPHGVILNHSAFSSIFYNLREHVTVTSNKYPEKIYVSRSRLGVHEGRILGERHIEKTLSEHGYTIIHPQDLTVNEQLAFYANARQIIFADGSAIHLFVLVASAKQYVYIIWRRKPHNDFNMQLKSFTGKHASGSCHVIGMHSLSDSPYNSARHKAVLDFVKLYQEMYKFGFITSARGIEPTTEEIKKELLELSKRLKKSFCYKSNMELRVK